MFASVNVPMPLTHSTPLALKRLATPPVICLTTAAFHSFAAAKSSSGSETVTPSFPNESRAWCRKCAVCTHALVGMQPDAQARAAELRLLLDADHLRAELGRADRGRVPAGAAAEDCDVDFHDRRS